jgi:riboflavin synthase
MFSGIVEEFGVVKAIEKDQENVHLTLTCSFVDQLKVDQSLSHNGVCLTVVKVDPVAKTYTVTAIKETLLKSNLGLLEIGSNEPGAMMMKAVGTGILFWDSDQLQFDKSG